MRTLEWVKQGSTKDIYKCGENYVFKFSDRYSVFDWGEMPDAIPEKGLALARITREAFRQFENAGLKTHWIPGQDDLASNEFTVKPAGSAFIPLEAIFRFGVPVGSSLLKRSTQYQVGQKFKEPLIEFSTKLEAQDRLLSNEEAQKLSKLTDASWAFFLKRNQMAAETLHAWVTSRGLELWDGKVEWARAENDFMLIDSWGPDECRLTLNSQILSKEALRQVYQNTAWMKNLEIAKKQDSENFREYCENVLHSKPEPLKPEVKTWISEMYKRLADVLCGISSVEVLKQLISEKPQ